MSKEKYLVTSALPYANGPLHLGHIAGAYLPADIFVRYNKMKGNDIIYICGSDEHGVPITIKAEQEGVSPQEVVNRYHDQFVKSFDKLNIKFDNFSGTARPVHHKMTQEFFTNLYKNNYISEKEIQQYYCDHDKMFLPDRFLEGTCPYCNNEKARGDECPRCGKWLEPEKLINPRCKLCSTQPTMKNTTHWFLRLDLLQTKLENWLKNKDNLKENVKHFAFGWMKEGLNERAITRDIKWGIPVPLENAMGKVLYVWFDAPIGYISSTIEWSDKIGQPEKWKDYWLNKDCKLIHFIGKDNVPFHIIVWPAILIGQENDFILPYDVPANEHLTIEGSKLSTSEGNVVWVDDFLDHYPADYLRYYLSAMAPESKDSDFSWKGFQDKINIELNNVLGNFINRTLTFTKMNFEDRIPSLLDISESDQPLINEIKQFPQKISNLLSKFSVRESIFELMHFTHLGNRYFDHQKPWELIKSNKQRCGTVINICVWMIKVIAPVLYPFLPTSSEKLWEMIGEKTPVHEIPWDNISNLNATPNQFLGKVHLLFEKIDDKQIEKVIAEIQKKMNINKPKSSVSTSKSEIGIEDFHKIELKVATVKECEKLEKSNKLLKLKIDLGNETRQIISGVAKHYDPEDLIGKQVIVVTNLKKAKLMGELSEGMILFASSEKDLIMITPEKSVINGSEVG